MANPETETHSVNFSVKETSLISPAQALRGFIVGVGTEDIFQFIAAVEALGEKTEQGILAVLSGEFNYGLSGHLLPQLIDSGVTINGLLTFGGTRESFHSGETHLAIVSRDLHIPFCFAQKPVRYWGAFPFQEKRWLQYRPLARAAGQLGTMTLSSSTRKVRLQY